MFLLNKVLNQENYLKKLTKKILNSIKQKIDGAEVSFITTHGINVSTRYGKTEYIEFNNNKLFSITIYDKYRKGHASSTDFNIRSINSTVEAAINIAKYTSIDYFSKLPKKELLAFDYLDLNLFHPIEYDVQKSLQLASKAENEALQYDKRIVNTEGSVFNSTTAIRVFGNTKEMLQSYHTTRYFLSTCVIAKNLNNNDEMQRDFYYTVARDVNDLKKPELVGKKAARRVLSRLGARKLFTTKAPVIIESRISSNFFSHLYNAINGENVYKKSTFLLNCLGRQILPDWLSIMEDPHLLKGLASKPFDNEGVRTKNRVFVKNGVLRNWFLNNYSAHKLNFESTGHFGGYYNWKILNYFDLNFKELLKYMGKGLLVTELMGHGVNIVTGNYSRGVVGFWVENGIIQYPVSEVTISGNLKHMFRDIVKIGNDINHDSFLESGSILLSEMNISGM